MSRSSISPNPAPEVGDTGVVLAGAGARGAFEAGALAGSLPVLDGSGRRPRVFVGTSAGALNAVLFASLAHLSPDAAGRAASARWDSIAVGDVLTSPVRSLSLTGLRYLGGLLGLPLRAYALLDPAPLLTTLAQGSVWEDLHRNVADRTVSAVAVATTEVDTGRTVMWVEAGAGVPLPPDDAAAGITYVAVTLTPEHVAASAAIPIVFPPVELEHPGGTSAWYVDGGVRLNAPLAPAIGLGAESLVVVSTDVGTRPLAPVSSGKPAIPDVVDQVLHTITGDRLVIDLASLRRTNRLLAGGGQAQTLGGRDYREIPFLLLEPGADGDLGLIAAEALARVGGTLNVLRPGHGDLDVLGFLLQASPEVRGDLLSYLFFDAAFTGPAVALGREAATRATWSR